MRLMPCPSCRRHVRLEELVCPFCSRALGKSLSVGGRLAALVASAGLYASACAVYGESVPCDFQGCRGHGGAGGTADAEGDAASDSAVEAALDAPSSD